METFRTELPGFGMPIRDMPEEYFPSASLGWIATTLLVRETTMMLIMNLITDKPEWDRKIFDETIVEKWRAEALAMDGMDVSEKMVNWCITELRDKVKDFQRTGLIAAIDGEFTIVKTDTSVSDILKNVFKSASLPLEQVPPELQDWHPGSDEKVLDLVHPSLFPLVYGRTRVLPEGNINLKDWQKYCGKTEVIQGPSDQKWGNEIETEIEYPQLWSKNFQWLPCNVTFEGKEKVSITSYINNLHPRKHANLYPLIEEFIAKSIPLWNRCLGIPEPYKYKPRMEMEREDYAWPNGKERPEGEMPNLENVDPDEFGMEDGEYDQYDLDVIWEKQNRVLIRPEPEDYPGFKARTAKKELDLRSQFHDEGLQVIIKLANIHLTPSKPSYEGGTWHVEGQLNEHICATSLYYYDSSNITDSYLSFRQRITSDEIELKAYEQNDYAGTEELYGIEQNGPCVQNVGRVLTREGRLLAFPNVLQHRVSPFQLADPTKPGHRKILALFLVDPNIRVLSTANVPPQQKEWWDEEIRVVDVLDKLPQELVREVMDEVGDFPIGMEEAKEIRLKLMEERKAYVEYVDREFESETFNFCEH